MTVIRKEEIQIRFNLLLVFHHFMPRRLNTPLILLVLNNFLLISGVTAIHENMEKYTVYATDRSIH
jgi:hypothetical protein